MIYDRVEQRMNFVSKGDEVFCHQKGKFVLSDDKKRSALDAHDV